MNSACRRSSAAGVLGAANPTHDIACKTLTYIFAEMGLLPQYDTFEAACASKGYVGEKALAQVANVEPSQIRNWKEIGRVPAVFFYKIATAPDLAMAKQQARQERERLREATRLARKQLQDAAKKAGKGVKGGKEPKQRPTGTERYERARAANPDVYARAEARFAELALAAIETGEKRLPTARIFEQVNREAENRLVREASARFTERFQADQQTSIFYSLVERIAA